MRSALLISTYEMGRQPFGLASPVALHAQGSAPPARSGAEMVLDPARHRVLLFGGKNDSGPLADQWELNLGG